MGEYIMSISEIVLIGIALSMDAFAVCIASSMVYTNMTGLRKLSMPILFGLFQGSNADFRVLSRKSFRIVY